MHRSGLLSTRRAATRALAVGALALAFAIPAAGAAFAQEKYPNKPVRVIVPFGAGGVGDVTARIVSEKMGDILGQRFVIENQPSAGGITAAQNVLREPADGYTIALFSNGTAISKALFKKLPFDPVTQFAPVSSMAYFDFVFVTSAEKPYKTLGELLAAGKAKPGALNIGTVFAGSTQNLSAELFKSEAGLDARIVPHKTTPDLMLSTMRGDVDVMIDSYSSLNTNIKDGKLRALATSGPTRSPFLPNVPTVAEAGVKGFDVLSWNAFFVHADTPKPIIETLNAAMRKAIADPEIVKRAEQLGIEPRASSPEEIKQRLVEDIAKWSAVIEKAGVPKR